MRHDVLISDYFECYRLAAYIASGTTERIGIVMGVSSLQELFDEKYYTQLPGGILESFGRLFKQSVTAPRNRWFLMQSQT